MRFEYKTVFESTRLGTQELNDYGKSGWELVTVIVTNIDNNNRYNYIFKRELKC